MPDNNPSATAGGSIKIPKWGPPKLRSILETIESALNMIRPVAGMGIVVDENKNGSQISQAEPKTSDGSGGTGSNGGGGSSGTPVNLYGVLNGAPATYHLLQSSAPTPV